MPIFSPQPTGGGFFGGKGQWAIGKRKKIYRRLLSKD